ncbi:MAG: peptidylprolyl isomerase [Saprospiraceae bacterium]|nr:peptidylprolyl isomerase [Saprospiraceae bacterium]MBP9209813.1 peptidylprolyl isomerase [Saprospiraceae bacterium]
MLIAFFCCQCAFAQKAAFRPDHASVRIPATISFRNESKGADRYEWSFGDGAQSTEVSPSHLYLKSGRYVVILKAFKGKKMKQVQHEIDVLPPEGCVVSIETPMGTMVAKLYDQTPKHRDNFFKLVEEGFFDDLLFHRVISGFMIQGGDPNSRGADKSKMLGGGGPGYTVPAEFNPALIHKKGALAAARTGDQVNPKKESSGSQFYIVQGNVQSDQSLTQNEERKGIRYNAEQRAAYQSLGGTPFLDMDYTVFGEVVYGLEVIDKIAATKTERGDRPAADVTMKIRAVH